MYDSPSSILKISKFDTWLCDCLPFNSRPYNYRIQQGIGLIKKRKCIDKVGTEEPKISIRSNFLLVPDRSNSDTNVVVSSKVVRIE